MMMDGIDDMLEVYHTDALLLGANNGDYTISLSFLQTVETDIEHEWGSLNIMQKGNWESYRDPQIWKNQENTGFCLSCLPGAMDGVK